MTGGIETPSPTHRAAPSAVTEKAREGLFCQPGGHTDLLYGMRPASPSEFGRGTGNTFCLVQVPTPSTVLQAAVW